MSLKNLVPETETFEQYTLINRKPYSKYLTQFLIDNHHQGYVINLNAEWGAGKTTFLHCWYNELKKNHPVIYFDAWKSDFTHDSMLALMHALQEQLASPLSDNKSLINSYYEKGSVFVKSVAPHLLLGYMKHKVGKDINESLLDELSNELNIEPGDMSDALKETMKSVFAQKKRVEGIEEFKSSLIALKDDYLKVHEGKKKAPVFVLIDELDRCRPTYAIEVIECIKHFFNTKEFVFILATDTNQLQHSIKSIYGQNFEALHYLSRFFNNTVTLPAPETLKFVQTQLAGVALSSEYKEKVYSLICSIFEWHGIDSLREIKKILAVANLANSQKKAYNLLLLILLSTLNRYFPEQYSNYKRVQQRPYASRHNNQSEQPIRGQHIRFPLTTQQKVLLENILYRVLLFQPTDRFYEHLANSKPENSELDHVTDALIREALVNVDNERAGIDEHLKLIEFAGYIGEL